MYRNTKVATCCYCGTRAALVLDQGRHELACAACGAPLSELKSFRPQKTGRKSPSKNISKPKKYKKKIGKKKVGKLFEDILDEIGDLFD
ncbi:hypothetical protein [Tropicimonas sp. IMCC6043]|uniref:hypothetical protein n=1 Tax=Tropicimonas sp. IMCC6043 TaxID=2510645 RepID=UPI00101D05FC|nr:hypothetical protein [Tropicimonas sp. IMCC6043]RYH09021.1 hypothetical protein EU800_13660 [Tropicimonas sp. IMCC6043]